MMGSSIAPPTTAPEWLSGTQVLVTLLAALLLATLLVVRATAGSQSMLRSQVTSWWWLLPPVFLAWSIHPWGVWCLLGVINGLAAWELAALAGTAADRHRLAWRLGGLSLAVAAAAAAGAAHWAVAGLSLLAVGQWAVWRRAAGAGRVALLQALFAAQAAGLGCLALLAPPAGGPGSAASWFLYLCVLTALNDIAQFLSGKRFGRHALARRISPNKTWQGAAGGVLASAAVSVAMGHTLGLAGTGWLLAMGIVLSLAGLAGDLLFSAGKRHLGIKDYSRLIPGHGGILDRVDSLVLTAPTLLLALQVA